MAELAQFIADCLVGGLALGLVLAVVRSSIRSN